MRFLALRRSRGHAHLRRLSASPRSPRHAPARVEGEVAAIDRQRGTGGHRGRPRGEEQHCADDVAGIREPSHGDASEEALHQRIGLELLVGEQLAAGRA